MRVEWTVLEGGQTESVLATCIYIDHPRSNRIRPSRGDGGIDVLEPVSASDDLFDVWQIKRFAANLGSSEKRQIEKSFRRILLSLVRRNIPLRNWHLVLPLDPTVENRLSWFNKMPKKVFEGMKTEKKLELTQTEIATIQTWLNDKSCEITWKGLDFCESMVAAHPEVPDYFLHGGRERLRDAMQMLTELLTGAQSLRGAGDSTAVLQPVEVESQLRKLQQALDGDPHFRYGFQVEPRPTPVHATSDLVAATQQTLPNGQTLTYRIYERFAESLNERPIPVKLEFAFEDPAFDRKAFEDWRDYGVEFNGFGSVNVDLPGGLDGAGSGRIRLAASPSPTFQRRYRIATPEGRKIADLMFNCSTTTGLSKKSARVTGVNAENLLAMEFKGSLEGDSAAVSFTAEPMERVEASRAAQTIRFLGAWRAGNRLQVGEPFGGKFADIHPIPTGEELVHPLIVTWVEALAEIQDHVAETILLPPFDTVTYRDVRDAVDAAAMMRGQTVVARWIEMELTSTTHHLAEGHSQLETDEPLLIRVGHQELLLGAQRLTFLSASITVDGSSVRAVPHNNDTVHRVYLGPDAPTEPQEVRGRPGDDPTMSPNEQPGDTVP